MLTQDIGFTPGVSESSILSRVHHFAEGNSLYAAQWIALAGNDRPPVTGGVDSRRVAEMISFVEYEFGVLVSSCEITEDNFGSIRAVASFVAGKQPFAVG